jgi:hypothetical protein
MDGKEDKEQKISLVIHDFHSQIAKILKVVDSKRPNDLEVDRLKRLIRIARDEEPLLIMNKCKDKIWDSRLQIRGKNMDYFLSRDYNEFVKKDGNQMFIESLINLVKRSREELNEKEIAFIWKVNNKLLDDVCEYKILTEDYE